MKALLLYLLPVCYAMLPATHETPASATHPFSVAVKKSFFRLGDRVITLQKRNSARERSFVLVNLHSNETGLIEQANRYIRSDGGELLLLENEGQEWIEAEVLERKIRFDPNQIFTFYGRKFKPKKGINYKIDQYVRQLADFITDEITDGKDVVEIHAHRSQEKNLLYYLHELRKKTDVKGVYQNANMDVNDYFLTSDEQTYQKLQQLQFNVVWQSSQKLKTLGSLDFVCRKMKSKYLQLTALADHTNEQARMLEAVYRIFE